MIKIDPNDITEITIPKVNEVLYLPLTILLLNGDWWLQSKTRFNDTAATVGFDGYIELDGKYVNNACLIRPALRIKNIDKYSLIPCLSTVRVFNYDWLYIDKDLILAKDFNIGKKPFYDKTDWKSFWDKHEFKDSMIYTELLKWLKEQKEGNNE